MGLLVSWTIIFLIIKSEFHSLPTARQQFVNRLRKMGKITQEERVVLSIPFHSFSCGFNLIAKICLW